jgi:uncharacterized protein YggE
MNTQTWRKRMKHHISAAVLSLLMVPSAMAEPELKGSPAELAGYLSNLPRLVSIAGEGEVKVSADRAVITLGVSTENKSLAEALRANDDVRTKLATLLKEHGFGPDQMHASKFSSTPKFGVFSEKAKSYRVENHIKFDVRDEKEFLALLSAADKFTEVSYVGVEFEHSDKEALKAKASAQACDNAMNRRQIFENKLGLKLTPRQFTESSQSALPRQFPSGLGDHGGSPPAYSRQLTPLPGRGEAGAEPISAFGELIFKVVVTVEFSVESK